MARPAGRWGKCGPAGLECQGVVGVGGGRWRDIAGRMFNISACSPAWSVEIGGAGTPGGWGGWVYAPASARPSVSRSPAIDIDQQIINYNLHFAPLCYTSNVELCLARTATGGPQRPTDSIFYNLGD